MKKKNIYSLCFVVVLLMTGCGSDGSPSGSIAASGSDNGPIVSEIELADNVTGDDQRVDIEVPIISGSGSDSGL